MFEFYDDKGKWVPLTKQGGGFYAESKLKGIFGGERAMKNFLRIVEAPSNRDKTVKETASKLNSEVSSDLQIDDIAMEKLPEKTKEI